MKGHRSLILFICFFLCLCLSSCHYSIYGNGDNTDGGDERGELTFEGRRFSYSGDQEDIDVENDLLTLREAGTYRIRGELSEGRIAVDTRDGGGVRLILDSVSISSSLGPALSARCPLTIESAKDTVNRLSSKAVGEDEGFPKPCVFGGGSVTLCGEGLVLMESEGDCALLCLTELFVNSGALRVSSDNYGIWVRDGLFMSGGRLTVGYSKVGIFSPDTAANVGAVEFTGGVFTALCEEKAVLAKYIRASGGSASLDAPIFYESHRGEVHISSEGFPKYENNSKK